MKLVVAEKPSVARNIAKVLQATKSENGYLQGSDYIVTWCIGHLVELVHADYYESRYKQWNYEDLPIVPKEWHYTVSKGKEQQYQIIKELMHKAEVTSIVCATDSGREGELIFRLVYNLAQCHKPVERLWISSMEDNAISEGFKNLKSGLEYENLYMSALCRSQADWLVGINMTRLFSTIYGRTLNVGRVQSPTLSILVDRKKQIESFTREKYYVPTLTHNEIEFKGEKVRSKEQVEKIISSCKKANTIVLTADKKKKSVTPPKLYDLTTLQREANRLLGYTATQTLDYLQSLYENKLITYPRTDSRYITKDMIDSTIQVCNQSKIVFGFDDVVSEILVNNIINDDKVTDHHAIIPTSQIANLNIREPLPEYEIALLQLIVTRLLSATSINYDYEQTKVVLLSNDIAYSATGKTVLNMGWKSIEKKYLDVYYKQKEKSEVYIPSYIEGSVIENVNFDFKESYTKPAVHYTEDTLLAAMENATNGDKDIERKGLGTAATRANIIDKIVNTGFVERKGKHLVSTDIGDKLISILPEEIKVPNLTAEWENMLLQVSKGEEKADNFMAGIKELVTNTVKTYKPTDSQKEIFPNRHIELGKCPKCSNAVYEGRNNFYCDNRQCNFSIWKNSKFFETKRVQITKEHVKTLLEKGKVKMSNLYSPKTKKPYKAYILLDLSNPEYTNFTMEFINKKRGGK